MIDIINKICLDLNINISSFNNNELLILERNKIIKYIINSEFDLNYYNSTILCNNKILLNTLLEKNNINIVKSKKQIINNFRIIVLNKNIEVVLKKDDQNYQFIDLTNKDLNKIKKLALKSFQTINGLIFGFIDIIEDETNKLIVVDINPNIVINKLYEINQEKFYLLYTKVIKFMFNIEDNSEWYVYLIKNKNCTYVGATNNTERRIKKHNGELSGGAKYTASKGSGWEYICIISGFDNKINALRFEWAFKHEKPKKAGGIKNRIKKLISVVSKEKWTEKSPLATSLPLCIKWYDTSYKPDNVLFPDFIKSH